jgi:hypothetical protein
MSILIIFLIYSCYVSIVISIGDDFALPIVADFGRDFVSGADVEGDQTKGSSGWKYGFITRAIGAPVAVPSSATGTFQLFTNSSAPDDAWPRWYLPYELGMGVSGDFPYIGYGRQGMMYGFVHPALNDTVHYDAVVRVNVDQQRLNAGLLCHFEYASTNPTCTDGVDIQVYVESFKIG